jgi:hypothetical protein
MTTQLLVKVDASMKEMLAKLARAEGKNSSQVIRELIETYVRDRDIGAYVDGLWSRVGDRMKSRNLKPADVPRVIRSMRRRKVSA